MRQTKSAISPTDALLQRPLPSITEPLLIWYNSQARQLPWRDQPSPYRIWISEIMLQQTRVEAVKPYFERFIAALPRVQALAASPETELFKLWEGLGYYNRARNLQKAARIIHQCHQDKLPANYDELLALPGIGRYTAGAIASIAYGIPVPAVDGNVLRVISRLTAARVDIGQEKTKRAIEGKLEAIMPRDFAGNFNQALMELGALICLPKGAAKCPLCPLKQLCLGNAQNLVMELPMKAPKKKRRREQKTVFLLVHDNKFALCKRPDSGLLAGLWELPQAAGCLSTKDAQRFIEETYGLPPGKLHVLPDAKHIFTHIEWQLSGYAARLTARPNDAALYWATPTEFAHSLAVPAAFQHYTKYLPDFIEKNGAAALRN